MSPAEINGLQHLAIAHGGSLTINPETGLPEANFMKDWLPAIVGGLTMLIPGIGPFAAMALAAGTSFGTSMAVGNSFNKSLMAGLASGAGAGIGGALGGAGAAAAGEAGALTAKGVANVAAQGGARAATTAAIDVAGTEAASQAGPLALKTAAQQAATRVPVQTVNGQIFGRAPTAIFDTATDFAGTQGANIGKAAAGYPTTLGSAGASNVGSALYNPATALATRTPSQATQFFSTAMPTGGRLPVNQISGLSTEPIQFNPGLSNEAIYKAAGPMEKLSLMKQGAGAEFASPEAAGEFAWNNKGKLIALGTGVAGNMMSDQQPLRAPPPEVSTYAGPYKPVERTTQFPIGPQPWTDTSERQYFNDVNPYPGVVPYKAAAGGLMGLAGGGSYDDEAGQDGYADGGEVGTRMATPDMDAIQNYVQSISQPQLQRAPQTQAPMAIGGEHNYGVKPVTVQQAPPVQYAPAPQRSGMEALFEYLGLFGNNNNNRAFGNPAAFGKGAPVPIVDKYTPYRPQTIEYTSPDGTKGSMEYTDLNNRIYNPNAQRMDMPFATGGMTSLARGGSYLDGPGDGLSDSIPATIGNRQPARLADGEFVISADVVSDIGGGSSKAGAKKLHAMMDRVRQSAHGTKKQVKKINDRKVLAA